VSAKDTRHKIRNLVPARKSLNMKSPSTVTATQF